MQGCARWHRRGVAAVAGLGMLLVCARASAQRVVVADIIGEGDEAAAVTLLLRSMLREGQRPSVPLAELHAALDKTPAARGAGAPHAVDPAEAPSLLKAVGADRLIHGELVRDDKLNLSLRVV